MDISFITVGGTIDKVYFDEKSEYEVGDTTIDIILKHARVNFNYRVTSLLKKDSLDMTEEDREMIYNAVKKEKQGHPYTDYPGCYLHPGNSHCSKV